MYKMKHTLSPSYYLLLLVILLIPTSTTQAQEELRRQEFRIGAGIGEDSHFDDVTDSYQDNYNLITHDGSNSGDTELSFFAEYLYHFNKHLAVGLSAGYARVGKQELWDTSWDTDPYNPSDSYPSDKHINLKTSTIFVMPTLKFTWYNNHHFAFYSRGGLGGQYYKLDAKSQDFPERHESHLKLSYQFSPAGIEVGGDLIRFFTELGYGKQGVFNMGVVTHF